MTANHRSSEHNSRKLIAVFGGALHSEKEYSFLSRFESACREHGFFILAFSFSGENLHSGQGLESEFTLIRLVEDLPLCGIVMLRESLTSDMLVTEIKRSADARNIPIFSLEKPTDDCINIIYDYRESFKMIVRHVIDVHRASKIVMIGGIKGNLFSEERIDGYKDALNECGIPFDENMVYYGDFWDRPTRIAMHEIIDSGKIPEAICCANDSMAITAVEVLLEAGFRVPEDVVVTGFDGIQTAHFNNPPISTMEPDYDAEVDIIITDITSYMETGTIPLKEQKLLYQMCQDTSCGCINPHPCDLKSTVSEINSDIIGNYWLIESMNHIISEASGLDSLYDLPDVVIREIGLWLHALDHVGIFAELTDHEYPEPDGHTYRTLYRKDHTGFSGMGDTYSEQVFLPGLESITSRDDIAHLIMVRLLHTASTPYGYIAECFDKLAHKEIRRCEIIGMFLSTAIGIILSNKKLSLLNKRLMQANREIADISATDYLTGILNRRGFFDKLKEALEEQENFGRYLTMFSIDMDGLKNINDSYGHEEGDFAIKTMADAIRSFAARNGFSSRYGGDEFACAIITDDPLDLSADDVRIRLHSVIHRKTENLGKEYFITASVGSCCKMIDHDPVRMNKIMEQMLRRCDEEMYRDKGTKEMHFQNKTE